MSCVDGDTLDWGWCLAGALGSPSTLSGSTRSGRLGMVPLAALAQGTIWRHTGRGQVDLRWEAYNLARFQVPRDAVLGHVDAEMHGWITHFL